MSTFVDVNGEKIAVHLYEPTTHIGDAILIHGFTGSKEDFETVGPHLADKGFRVVALDNRGQYESAHSSNDEDYAVATLARDAIAVAEHFGMKNPHLLGHSFGGLVAQRAAVDAPELWKSLTMLCSGPAAIPTRPDLPGMIEVLNRVSVQEAWDQLLEADRRTNPRYEFQKVRWAASDPRSTAVQARHLLSATSLIPKIAASEMPAHVIYGETDDAWPFDIQDQMAADLKAELTVIKNAGHCPNEDQPAETAEVLAKFWSSI
jgi:pimeloyl-ACP methyl ester carboxylesterase